jgi:hypothetical protein
VGKAAIEGILKHPELELVACWVHSADKNGTDVGEIIGQDPIGVAATNDADAILALDADCVVYAPMIPSLDEVAALLRSGKNVVTPVGWFYPPDKEAVPLRAACEAGNATLHGTGINPGGITELRPLMFSALSSAVTYVRGEEFSDIRSYAAPDVVRWIMRFGDTPEQAMSSPMLKLLSGASSSRCACAWTRWASATPRSRRPSKWPSRPRRSTHRSVRSSRGWWRRNASSGRRSSTAGRSSGSR